jgi:hypothetical protein
VRTGFSLGKLVEKVLLEDPGIDGMISISDAED